MRGCFRLAVTALAVLGRRVAPEGKPRPGESVCDPYRSCNCRNCASSSRGGGRLAAPYSPVLDALRRRDRDDATGSLAGGRRETAFFKKETAVSTQKAQRLFFFFFFFSRGGDAAPFLCVSSTRDGGALLGAEEAGERSRTVRAPVRVLVAGLKGLG